jgi:hypothetical protein
VSAPVVYLHIGTNKTGTSAIQRFLNGNRDQLKEFRLLYPTTGCQGEAHYGISHALNFSHGKSRGGNADTAQRTALRKALFEEIRASGANTVAISSENFVMPQSVEAVKTFFQPCQVRVIVYLRRHDEWWTSAYAQAVKMVENPPWGRSFEDYVTYQKEKNTGYGNYRFLVDRWARIFGRENIIVRPYEVGQNQPTLIGDFLCSIGQAGVICSLEIPQDRVNESIPFAAINLVDIYQRIEVGPEVRARLIRHALSISRKAGRTPIASPVLRRRLIDENAADYEYIAKEFLGRADGKLFLDPLPEKSESWKEPKRLNYMRVIEETAKALA